MKLIYKVNVQSFILYIYIFVNYYILNYKFAYNYAFNK